jgi:hypothetical protein
MPIFKQLKSVVELVNPITREPIDMDDKGYLLILVTAGSQEYDSGEFLAVRGRRVVFDYLLNSLGNYDIIHSYVLSGKIPLGGEVSVYSFMRLCLTKYFNTEDVGMTVEDLEVYANTGEESIDLDFLYSNEMNHSC